MGDINILSKKNLAPFPQKQNKTNETNKVRRDAGILWISVLKPRDVLLGKH